MVVVAPQHLSMATTKKKINSTRTSIRCESAANSRHCQTPPQIDIFSLLLCQNVNGIILLQNRD